MSLVLYDGPSFSGRSKALRAFAWEAQTSEQDARRGQYLHPQLEINQSGFAATVGGELYVHLGQPDIVRAIRKGNLTPTQKLIEPLIGGLPLSQVLTTLSGGELARLSVACAISLAPGRLSLDSTLEQLDGTTRRRLLTEVLRPLAEGTDVHVADNNVDDIRHLFSSVISFSREANAPNLAEPLELFTKRLATQKVNAPSIVLSDISFRYPGAGKRIFDRVNFTFESGKPYLLKAPNGSGKSTLARMLLGLLKPTQGEFRLNDRLFRPWAERTALLAYAFQNPSNQIFGRSVTDYLNRVSRAARRNRGLSDKHFELLPSEVRAGFGIDRFSNEEPFELPFLARKWLTIAAALLSRRNWVFLDEPALTAANAERKALRQLVNTLVHCGLGVIIVTHGNEFDSLTNAHTISIVNGQIVESNKNG